MMRVAVALPTRPHGRNAAVLHRDVRVEPRVAAAIDDLSATNDQVIRGRLRSRHRRGPDGNDGPDSDERNDSHNRESQLLAHAGEGNAAGSQKQGTMKRMNVELDTAKPFKAYGSVQDAGSYRVAIDTRAGRSAFTAAEMAERAGRARAVITRSIPPIPALVYSHGFYGSFTRAEVDAGAGRGRPQRAWQRDRRPEGRDGHPAEGR